MVLLLSGMPRFVTTRMLGGPAKQNSFANLSQTTTS